MEGCVDKWKGVLIETLHNDVTQERKSSDRITVQYL